MQKLSYINLNNERIEFFRDPYILSEIDGVGYPDMDIYALQGAYQHGDTLAGYRRGARHVDVTIHIRGETRSEMYQLRNQLMGLLSPDKAYDGTNRAKLLYENDYGRWWTWAIADEYGSGKRHSNYLQGIKLSFRCESPYWYSGRPEVATFSYSGDGFELPFEFPISFGSMNFSQDVRNTGQVRAYPEVWIYGRGETPMLKNLTLDTRIALRSALPDGSVMYCNTDPARLTATITDSAGNSQNAFGQLDIAYPLTDFWLRPGINQLLYLPDGASTQSIITVKWYAAYEGV